MGLEGYIDIPGYSGYKISNTGDILSFKKGQNGFRVKHIYRKDGYYVVGLYKNGKLKQEFVHRLVLEAFVGPCPEGYEACHGDGMRWNNSLYNLRWDTRSANQRDRQFHGTSSAGEQNNLAKLKIKDVKEIRRLASTGTPRALLSKIYNVTVTNIAYIIRGNTWKDIA